MKTEGQSIIKGTAYLIISQLIFLLAGYLVHIALARKLGPELYGVFGVLMSLYLINRAFFGNGLPKAVSKILAESKNVSAIVKSSFKLQILLTISFTLLYILLAGKIALILKDPGLEIYIVYLGFIMIPLSLLSLCANGFLNGLRMFKQQAIAKILNPTFRVIFTLLFLYLGFKLFGALTAYLLGLIIALVFCVGFLKATKKGSKESKRTKEDLFSLKKRIIIFALPLTVASLANTLLRNVNVLFIKSLLTDNLLVGLYTAAATISNIPFIVFAPFSFTLLPVISKSMASNKILTVRNYISQGVRYLLILLLPVIALSVATSKELLVLLYSADYSGGAMTLSILLINTGFLTLFTMLVTIITGSGKPKFEMKLSLLFIILLSIFNLFAVPRLGINGAALSFLSISIMAFIITVIYVYHHFKFSFNFFSLIRILFSSVIIFIIAYLWNVSGVKLLFVYIVLSLLYFFLLYSFGELKHNDLTTFRKIVRRS